MSTYAACWVTQLSSHTLPLDMDGCTTNFLAQLHALLSGTQAISNFSAAMFLEALDELPDPVALIEKLILNAGGLITTLSIFDEPSLARLKSTVTELLLHLRSRTLAGVGAGYHVSGVTKKLTGSPSIFEAAHSQVRPEDLRQDRGDYAGITVTLHHASVPLRRNITVDELCLLAMRLLGGGQAMLPRVSAGGETALVPGERIIGCETPAAAAYSTYLRATFTAIVRGAWTAETLDQEIVRFMIQGHQGRVRIGRSSRLLAPQGTVGCDLNRSLFELLVLHERSPLSPKILRVPVTYLNLLTGPHTPGQTGIWRDAVEDVQDIQSNGEARQEEETDEKRNAGGDEDGQKAKEDCEEEHKIQLEDVEQAKDEKDDGAEMREEGERRTEVEGQVVEGDADSGKDGDRGEVGSEETEPEEAKPDPQNGSVSQEASPDVPSDEPEHLAKAESDSQQHAEVDPDAAASIFLLFQLPFCETEPTVTFDPSSPTVFHSPEPAAPQPSEESEPVPTPEASPPEPEDKSEPPPLAPSLAGQRWQRQKDADGKSNEHLDAIMEMTGLEHVKQQILRIKDKIDIGELQGTSVEDECFNIVLQGNPGTGKTTVAKHYAKFLRSLEVVPSSRLISTTGTRLANAGLTETKEKIEYMVSYGGGVVLIEQPYDLTSTDSTSGTRILDYLLEQMETQIGKIAFILVGDRKEMQDFFEDNPGLVSRIPYTLEFSDYTDAELLHMLASMIVKKYSGKMKVEDGKFGLYMRIAVRRLGQGRGRDGFGNATALHTVFTRIAERQAARIAQERESGNTVDHFLLTQEDIIGPDPSQAIFRSEAWRKLQALTALDDVKQSVRNMFDLITVNYQRELKEKPPIKMSLNRVFLGNPGTGKTTVAKLYGQILADLGFLSNGEVVVKNATDFVGAYIGWSEKNTKRILAATVGKVLVIDEAYALYKGSAGGDDSDRFRTAVIDTLVGKIQNVPGEDRCVLLCGYEDVMREMFQNVNPGLSRRFAIEDAFRFDDFSDSELLSILDMKLAEQSLHASQPGRAVASELLSRARNRPNFGNGGEVDNLLSKAKGNYQFRYAKVPPAERPEEVVFEPADFDPDFNRTDNSDVNLKKLFLDVIGCENVIEKLRQYQNIARVMKARGKQPRDARELIPTTFVFKGPPGTGKTMTARKMGKVYYDMGFLSSSEVIECSASDLVAQYVGQTGPKTMKVFERALGKVLFVDEAYRLAEGQFAKEAMDELVGILTNERFIGKLIVILAGYDHDMNRLLSANAGLSSRFPEEICFTHLPAEHCLAILARRLERHDVVCDALYQPESQTYCAMVRRLHELATLPAWGNARDIGTLAQRMVRIALAQAASSDLATDATALPLRNADALACVQTMLNERQSRRVDMCNGATPHGTTATW